MSSIQKSSNWIWYLHIFNLLVNLFFGHQIKVYFRFPWQPVCGIFSWPFRLTQSSLGAEQTPFKWAFFCWCAPHSCKRWLWDWPTLTSLAFSWLAPISTVIKIKVPPAEGEVMHPRDLAWFRMEINAPAQTNSLKVHIIQLLLKAQMLHIHRMPAKAGCLGFCTVNSKDHKMLCTTRYLQLHSWVQVIIFFLINRIFLHP